MKKIVFVLVGFLIAFIVLEIVFRIFSFFVLYNPKNLKLNKKEIRILCLGESTTIGMGSNSWPLELEKVLNSEQKVKKFRVINKGLPVINSDYIAENLVDNLIKYEPTIVISMMGINDNKTEYYKRMTINSDFLFNNLKFYRFISIIFRNFYLKTRNKVDSTKGIIELERKLIRFPHDSKLLTQLGLQYFLNDGSYLEKARKVLEEALKVDEKNLEAYRLLSGVYVKLSLKDKNDELLHKGIKIFPSDNRLLRSLIEHALESNDYNKAMYEINEFIKNNVNSDIGYFELGWCLFMKNNIEEAKKVFYKPIEINPYNDMAYLELAKFFIAINDIDKAKDLCKKVLEINPQNSRAKDELSKILDLSNEYINPRTFSNLVKINNLVSSYGAILIVMQYPLRSINPLRKIFVNNKSVLFCDNEENFKKAIDKDGYNYYFVDKFAGDFGHCTLAGNKLIAENVARVIKRKFFDDENKNLN